MLSVRVCVHCVYNKVCVCVLCVPDILTPEPISGVRTGASVPPGCARFVPCVPPPPPSNGVAATVAIPPARPGVTFMPATAPIPGVAPNAGTPPKAGVRASVGVAITEDGPAPGLADRPVLG